MNKGWFEPRHTQHPRRQGGVMSESCTCLLSMTATSATIHNADPNCPVHGQGSK